jgi:NAD-dependent deacetylase
MHETTGLPERLLERLADVRSVGAITGAGVSAESGIPTYRGRGGIYDDPEEGDRTVEALSGHTLRSDPDRTWRAVAELARDAERARPGAAHRALAAIESRAERFVLLTQNVDGLHQLAGTRNVIDIHGHVFDTVCMGCRRSARISREELVGIERSPRCEACGALVRPDVVLFGEMLPMDKIERILRELVGNPPDLLIVAGTTALFPYIQDPVRTAAGRGRVTVEVNPERTALSAIVDFVLTGPAGLYLPAIEAALGPSRPE